MSAKGDLGFRKDRTAHRRLAGEAVPIPAVLEVGEVRPGLHYAVSERPHGTTLDALGPDAIARLMPEIVRTLDAIHATPPPGGGFGWDPDGHGWADSWRAALEAGLGHEDPRAAAAGFHDAALAAGLRAEIVGLLDAVPEERALVHWDFGFDNVLSDGARITGVIDWEHSAYGDPLHDVAWLDFWASGRGYAPAFERHYAEQGRDVPRFHERIACYKLLIGLMALTFFAASNQPHKYAFAAAAVSRIARPA